MLVDQLENTKCYPFGPAWEKVSRFLAELPPDTVDGEYRIEGDDIFARVMTYTTRAPEDAVLEAHRDYADVQSVLVGSEAMAWFPAASLTVTTPYDSERDAEFYQYPGAVQARVTVVPGRFILLLPGDAHMFALAVDDLPMAVKKVVVKVRMAQLFPAESLS